MTVDEKAWTLRLERWGAWARSGRRRSRSSSLWLVMRQGIPQGSAMPPVNPEECFATDRLIVEACDDTEKDLLRARFIHGRSARWIEEHLRIYHSEFRGRLLNILIKLDKCEKIIIIRAN